MAISAPHICALIPTYNNAGTIADVIRRVYAQMENIIVVADGPTDNTLDILSSLDVPFTLVSYAKNAGKGHALRMGFKKARELGYSHVLTIDSDGQHYPEDIPALYRAHTLHPEGLIIGSRGLVQENMPGKNTFANKFSNFWFAVQTGCRLPDTQTGMRIYPLRKISGEWLMTSRYEAELELLVFSAWANVEMVPVAIRVYYPPKEERVSHFRPAYDFTRISILNTILCIIALVYGLPRRWWRAFVYYTLFLLDVIFVIQPALLFLRIRYGQTAQMHHKLHLLMKRNARNFLSLCPAVKFRTAYEEGAQPIDESKPAVIIANHSSVLDLLSIMTLHTRVAIVTKDWVSRNVLYGSIARSFDILPVKDGIEAILPEAEKRVKEGFSIVIMPEGTRSRTGELGRFHRGAFYLAEQLNLPIRPIIFRGFYQVLCKPTWYIGCPKEMSIHIMPEIAPDDASFGNDYKERTRALAAYYRDRLDCIAYPYAEKD